MPSSAMPVLKPPPVPVPPIPLRPSPYPEVPQSAPKPVTSLNPRPAYQRGKPRLAPHDDMIPGPGYQQNLQRLLGQIYQQMRPREVAARTAQAEAAKEAYKKLLPSKHLRNAATFDVHYLPSQEFQLGLYQATQKAGKNAKVHRFASLDDVKRAYRRGEIALTDQVVIGA